MTLSRVNRHMVYHGFVSFALSQLDFCENRIEDFWVRLLPNKGVAPGARRHEFINGDAFHAAWSEAFGPELRPGFILDANPSFPNLLDNSIEIPQF